jgi:DNA-binding response OmpR family regulator
MNPHFSEHRQAAALRDAIVPATSQSNPGPRILVVEDELGIREVYSRALTCSGYRVDTAEDGEEGWELLQVASPDCHGYDLLITDNNMPNLSGVDLVKRLRAERMPLPVILASGSVPVNTAGLQLEAVLHKPFSPDELVRMVKETLSHAGSDRPRPRD